MKMFSAFTLIELLAPALDKAVYRAELLTCQGQTRVITMGSLSYATRHRGAIPLYKTWHPHFVYSSNPPYGMGDGRALLLSLTGKRETWYCPLGRLKADTAGPEWDTVLTPATAGIMITYSPIGIWEQTMRPNYPDWKTMYTSIPEPSGWTNRPNRLANAVNPSSTALVVDSQRSYQLTGFSYPGHPEWTHAANDPLYPHRRDDQSWDSTSSAFFDGHSEWRTFEEFFDQDDEYPYGADWFMWRNRGIEQHETPYWW